MHPDARTRLVIVAALSLLCLTGAARRADARIELDNDVVIDWSQCSTSPNCGSGSVIGAPRLIRNFEFGKTSLRLRIDASARDADRGITAISLSYLDIVLRRADTPNCLESNDFNCVFRFHLEELNALPRDAKETINALSLTRELSDFTPVNAVGDMIVTVEAHVTALDNPANVTITLSGDGNEVAFDRIGDVGFNAGDAADVPTRSLELLRALDQLESSFLPRRSLADPDGPLPRRGEIAVGFTHAIGSSFDVSRIREATLTLRLKRTTADPGNDFVLLDRGVRDVAGGRGRVAVIYLRDLPPPLSSAPGSYDFTLDLTCLPVSLQSVGDPPLSSFDWRSVANELRDGRLNVVVVGTSSVDFSDLIVTVRNP